jgi:hypothetical protein
MLIDLEWRRRQGYDFNGLIKYIGNCKPDVAREQPQRPVSAWKMVLANIKTVNRVIGELTVIKIE